MIDPVSAIAMATTAFKTVKKMVEVGRDIEDIAGQLGKWYTAAADITKADEYAKNPPLFKKLLFKGSVEEEALNLIIHKKKLQEQEAELRTMIMYRFGQDTYREMIQMRRDIAKAREKAIYRKKEMVRNLIEGTAIVFLIVFMLGVIGGFVWWIGSVQGKW